MPGTFVWEFVGILFGSVIGAAILRAACYLYNKLASKFRNFSAVDEPGSIRAILIVFVTLFLGGLAGTAFGILNPITGPICGLLVSFGVLTEALALGLPTTFARGIVIALMYYAIIASLVAIMIASVALVLWLIGI